MDANKKIFCTKCGAAHEPGTKFCTTCGNKMEEPVFAPVAEEPAPAPAFAPIAEEPAPAPAPAPAFAPVAEKAPVKEEAPSVFADGLPEWDIVPPQVMVRRR